jgi:branched-chain amino acid transport system substrate-binding protein
MLGLLVLGLLAGCTGAKDTGTAAPAGPDTIKIGLVAPVTGPAGSTGDDMKMSAELAALEINADGGIMVSEYGRKIPIELVIGDTETNPNKGVEAVTRLVQADEVDLLVGGFSSAITYADSVIASEEGVPWVITGASAPVITHRTDIDTSYFFHHCPTSDDYPYWTLRFVDEVVRPAVNEKFGFSDDRVLKLAVVYQEGKYGEGVLSGVKKALEENPDWKIELVAEEPFTRSETNYQTVLTKVKDAKPDVVYPATFINEQVPLVTQGRRDVGLNTIYLAVEATDDPAYYSGVGEWGEYSIQETRFSPYTVASGPIKPAVNTFREDFNAKFGKYPSMMGAGTYEGVYIAADAIERAGTLEKDSVKGALGTTDMSEMVEAMVGGKITFTDNFRESKFKLYMSQFIMDGASGEPRPHIVWPDDLKETDFVLPDWYEAGE